MAQVCVYYLTMCSSSCFLFLSVCLFVFARFLFALMIFLTVAVRSRICVFACSFVLFLCLFLFERFKFSLSFCVWSKHEILIKHGVVLNCRVHQFTVRLLRPP